MKKKNVVINTMALVGLFLTYKIFNKNGVSPVESKLRFSLHICPLCFSPKTYQSEYLNHAGQFYNVNGWIFASR